MNITHMKIESFLGVRSLDIAIEEPIVLLAGRNAFGKSSIAEAMRFALLAEPTRVALKRDYPRLITDGASAASIEIVDGDGQITQVNIHADGRVSDSATGRTTDAALAICLDPHRFAAMSSDERRSFLFDLMDVETDGPAVRQRLAARGCDAGKIEAAIPLLRSGFPAACDEAKARARDAKSAWRTVTGETYGEKKAEQWQAPKPTVDATALSQAQRDQFAVEERIDADNRSLGELLGRQKDISARSARIGELRTKAARFAAIAEKLNVDRAELARLNGLLAALPPEVGAMRVKPHTDPCPHCGKPIMRDAQGRLTAYHPPQEQARPDAETERMRDQYRRAVELMESSLRNDQRDLDAADAATKALDELERAEQGQSPGQADIDALRARIESAQASKRELAQRIETMNAASLAFAEANRKTEAARQHHQDVLSWSALADALAPDGIPAELLSDALDPLNLNLEQSAEDTSWRQVRIDADMAITYGVRPYRLCSESERWRADAMIGGAVAQLSGWSLLVLDRADVLDIPSRAQLFAWLSVLAVNGEVDTAFVLATLKAIPETLPRGVKAVWIE